jgi:5-methyltetrahydrofolate--homocysteine methyltransferase
MIKRPTIHEILKNRILILDGAMGTMLQQYGLGEDDFAIPGFGQIKALKGNNDLLSLSRPQIVGEIHRAYLDAGADIIETNTFNANAISQADYGTHPLVQRINLESARLARSVADEYTRKNPGKPRFVAGSAGPTNKMLSLSPDVNEPGFRALSFDELSSAYLEQFTALAEGGVDFFLIETIFDALNAKAAIYAHKQLQKAGKNTPPVVLSVTVNDAAGRILSGQTLEAFLISTAHAGALAVGLNCALGPEEMFPWAEILSSKCETFTCLYPNAGLPNQFGQYEMTAEKMAGIVSEFMGNAWVNIIGGCCGTTPEHIRAIADVAAGQVPRKRPERKPQTFLAGLEPLTISSASNFINIGERTNVAGSRKFARLIREKKYSEAITVARQQVEAGAQILDISMDDAMLDASEEMKIFLNLIAAEPDIARVPLMPDSSRFDVLIDALKCVQGKCLVNSISLKDGEEEFVKRASIIHELGGAAIIMAFDESGQATDFSRKTEICQRAYRLLTEKACILPENIVFDANILTVATGIEEHRPFAYDFIRSVEWIKHSLPGAKTSGGISNLSFAFRGNDNIRECMHSVFLYHAIRAGLDMGIVNAGMLPVYDDIDPDVVKLCEDVILNKRKDATERLSIYAQKNYSAEKKHETAESWRNEPLESRILYALLRGIEDHIDTDTEEAVKKYNSGLAVIEGPLMEGMNKVGELFGEGKLFLPQVIKSARVMKKAVAILTPYIEEEKKSGQNIRSRGRMILATVRGDVHDIGKNITAVVLACNNYDIIDLGVMVSAEKIISEAMEHNADVIGLSGLITPSLEEMAKVATEMEKNGMKIPLLIGGATTSEIHTAVKIATAYSGPVIHVKDASQAVPVMGKLRSTEHSENYVAEIRKKNDTLRSNYLSRSNTRVHITIDQARKNRFSPALAGYTPPCPAFTASKKITGIRIDDVIPFIDWKFFFFSWKLTGKFPEIFNDPVKGEYAKALFDEAQYILEDLKTNGCCDLSAALGFYPVTPSGDDLLILDSHQHRNEIARLHFLRNQQKYGEMKPSYCLSDFILPENDHIGLFAVTAGSRMNELAARYADEGLDDKRFMLQILSDRMAEALAEYLHYRVRTEYWGYSPEESTDIPSILREKYRGIRPAPGYPCSPDHSEKESIFKLLDAENLSGISLTETYAMKPASSVCGYYFSHPDARYFDVGKIEADQWDDYCRRKQRSSAELSRFLGNHLNLNA